MSGIIRELRARQAVLRGRFYPLFFRGHSDQFNLASSPKLVLIYQWKPSAAEKRCSFTLLLLKNLYSGRKENQGTGNAFTPKPTLAANSLLVELLISVPSTVGGLGKLQKFLIQRGRRGQKRCLADIGRKRVIGDSNRRPGCR